MTEPTEPTREQIEKRIAQLEALVRFPQYAAIWDTDLVVYRMALRTLDAEEELDRARKLHASFPGSPLASEVIDGQASVRGAGSAGHLARATCACTPRTAG